MRLEQHIFSTESRYLDPQQQKPPKTIYRAWKDEKAKQFTIIHERNGSIVRWSQHLGLRIASSLTLYPLDCEKWIKKESFSFLRLCRLNDPKQSLESHLISSHQPTTGCWRGPTQINNLARNCSNKTKRKLRDLFRLVNLLVRRARKKWNFFLWQMNGEWKRKSFVSFFTEVIKRREGWDYFYFKNMTHEGLTKRRTFSYFAVNVNSFSEANLMFTQPACKCDAREKERLITS